jgi:hypothetical protein
MPTYQNSPFQKVVALLSGVPEYLYGKFDKFVSPAKLLVSQVELASDVATLTVKVVEGPIPAAGSLITVSGTQTGSGEFNVVRATLTAVSIDATTGEGTVSYALTASNVSATADAGVAIVDTPEIAETLAAGSSVACTPLFQQVVPGGQRTITAVVTFPTVPTDVTVKLQGADLDQDSEYTDVGTVATVANSTPTIGAATFDGVGFRFYRLNVSGLSGTGTIIGKVVMS